MVEDVVGMRFRRSLFVSESCRILLLLLLVCFRASYSCPYFGLNMRANASRALCIMVMSDSRFWTVLGAVEVPVVAVVVVSAWVGCAVSGMFWPPPIVCTSVAYILGQSFPQLSVCYYSV